MSNQARPLTLREAYANNPNVRILSNFKRGESQGHDRGAELNTARLGHEFRALAPTADGARRFEAKGALSGCAEYFPTLDEAIAYADAWCKKGLGEGFTVTDRLTGNEEYESEEGRFHDDPEDWYL